MRKLIIIFAAFASLVAAAPVTAATFNVGITRAGFVPDELTVRVGDTVTWTNLDTQAHQVVSQSQGNVFASPVLQPNQSFSYTFRTAGRVTVTDPLNRNRRMTITVGAPQQQPGLSVTIAARPQVVIYGGATTISGTVSSQRAGERVTLFAQACGGAFARVADVQTGTGGAYTFTGVKPLNNTIYRVEVRKATSPSVAVKVRPRVRLGKVAPRKFSVRVFAATSFAGKVAVFQRFNSTRRVWVKVRTVTLRASNTGIAPTVVSAANFTARVRTGLRVRLVLGQAQVGACHLAGRSNIIRS